MACSDTVKRHLSDKGVQFEVVSHSRTGGSMETAAAAHVSGEGLAKAVVLKDKDGHLVAVIPATHKLELGKLNESLGRSLEMAAEVEFADLFKDCDLGAVPPLAGAYGLDAVIDEGFTGMENVYFEGGDHSSLIKVSGADFQKLMAEADSGSFSHHV
tara:strand:- start:146 stop:616 length:471 start_codon:yes stop_codon:yes gene_type:complete